MPRPLDSWRNCDCTPALQESAGEEQDRNCGRYHLWRWVVWRHGMMWHEMRVYGGGLARLREGSPASEGLLLAGAQSWHRRWGFWLGLLLAAVGAALAALLRQARLRRRAPRQRSGRYSPPPGV